MDELFHQTADLIGGREFTPKAFAHRIAFNLIPQIDVFLENGYTKEEMKMVNETKKIMEDDTIRVSPTAVRVPVFYGHSESLNVETERKLTADEARALLASAPGVRVVDDPGNRRYPMPIEAAGQDDTLVGRIREDVSLENGLNLWIAADNIRKGAATNAVQIAEILVRDGLLP
jgi:aspartate-semialdehyde dehydrogenase